MRLGTRRSVVFPLVLAAGGVVRADPWPVATSYASIDPEASAEWTVKYLGAELIDVNVTMSCNSTAAWSRQPGSGYEWHFHSTPALANSNYSFADYVAYVDGLYGDLSLSGADTYDQFMDFHVGMLTEDMTPFYEALVRDEVPFFMVGQYPSFFDLFVEIPGTGAILELTSQRLDVPNATIANWDICVSNQTDLEWPQKFAAAPSSRETRNGLADEKDKRRQHTNNATFPVVEWRKTTFAAPHPIESQVWAIDVLGAKHIQQGHIGVWVRLCAKISWVEFDDVAGGGIPYQFHFVDGYRYPPHDTMDIVQFASLQRAQRDYARNKWDEWSNNHVKMWVDDLAPYYQTLVARNDSFLLRKQDALFSLIIDTTLFAGNVITLVSETFSGSGSVDGVSPWDFCP